MTERPGRDIRKHKVLLKTGAVIVKHGHAITLPETVHVYFNKRFRNRLG